ncbi:TonB-dependent receptor plug domain-containing protein [Pseudoduganella sp. FT25W]|uniref:TonB-dependent receptor plug domain-containing protein n=1 Tax=Duganella alba TaxID=2666081 RepID=A0A6L5QGM9_9BURK|nr:TonB-dependent receptor [Duganella alba]MRX08658.1 TonB-dependent receptor plug domain-containing protein [Duganella alba]MRX18220.1 TonB-dependent receptor plug domain-containing protein [Duganella alba]
MTSREIVVVVLGLTAVAAAMAQEEQPAAVAGQLQTVTVSAERRAENVKNVPVSATIIADDTLGALNSGGLDMQMLAGRAPSLQVESSFGRGFPRFYLRGYGNVDFHQNASQPVSLIYDDVVQESAVLKGFPAFDLERIEVLRGPQGSLFGRNTPAGVVKFDSVRPSQTPGGYLTLSDATHNTAGLEGAVNLPLGGDWAARVSLLSQHRDDWIGNAHTGQSDQYGGYNDTAARLQVLYQPGGGFSALANLHQRSMNGSASLFRANIIQKGSDALAPGFDIGSVSTDGQNGQHLNNYGGNLRLTWRLGDVTLHSVTGYETVRVYSRGDVDGGFGAVYAPPSGPGLIPFVVESADGTKGHHQLTQELRLESDVAQAFKWQAGLFYFDEKYQIDSYSYDTLVGGALTSDIRSHQKNDAYAVFGSINYDISPRFNLRAGLRYTRDNKDLNTEPDNKPGGGSDIDASAGLATSTGVSKVNWDISGVYKLNQAANVYGRVATGFRGATIQPAASFNPMSVARPETITSYEAGFKTDLLDRRARLSFDVYSYTVKDLQLTAVGGTSNSAILLNADRSAGRGAELDLDAYLTENLLWSFGGSYNYTRIKDAGLTVGACAACTLLNPTIVTGAGGTLVRIDGNPLPQAPRWSANTSLKYSHAVGNGEWYVYTDWVYRSAVNFTLYRSAEFVGNPLLTGGLRLGYKWDNDRNEVALFGRNITNRVQLVGGIDFNNLTGFVNDNNPRIFGIQASRRF